MESERADPRLGQDRRAAERRECVTGVRLIVLGPDYVPIAERFCSSLNLSPVGLAVSTPGPLEPGTHVLVCMPAAQGQGVDVWLACVAHCRLKPDGTRVVGLERRDMPANLAAAPWVSVLRSAA
ncbi:MAG: hypothetical protein KJZ65_12125 [Phycisphaerales bacterium]|nr:hypothetical protein [Phycisphaerales bacterium]